jgi:hypothetical protein
MATTITRHIIESYLNCKYKGHLQLTGQHGTKSDFELLLDDAREQVRRRAIGDRNPPYKTFQERPGFAGPPSTSPAFDSQRDSMPTALRLRPSRPATVLRAGFAQKPVPGGWHLLFVVVRGGVADSVYFHGMAAITGQLTFILSPPRLAD